MLNKSGLDGRPTTAEWPVRIWDMEEFPTPFKDEALEWFHGDAQEFAARDFVYAKKRLAVKDSFAYLFGYGKDEILYLKAEDGFAQPLKTLVNRCQIKEIVTRRELLNAEILIVYCDEGEEHTISFPYVPSVYYLYDPFLNWLLGKDKDFVPALAEKKNPRPRRLYNESLAMFNYSLGAYRLGAGFSDYAYRSEIYRHRWMPWKKLLEEWLEVPMESGTFCLHCKGYLTECRYRFKDDDACEQ